MCEVKLNITSANNRAATCLSTILAFAMYTLCNPVMAQDTISTPLSIEAGVSLEWDQTNGVYVAIGDAVVEQDDRRLKADEIVVRYNPQSEGRDLTDITATGSVVFIDGNNSARGGKLDYMIDDERYDLAGPKAIVTSPRGRVAANTSITYIFNDINSKQVVAIGEASFEDNEGRLVEGERVVAFLNEDGSISYIEAEGAAKVVTPRGIVATANRLSYLATTDRANLFGDVTIIDRDNIMRGARGMKSNLTKKSASCYQTTLANGSQAC